MGLAINILCFVIVLVGLVFLQIFLSKIESKLSGLVLPGISFLLSFLYPLNMYVPADGITTRFVFQLIFVWFLGNISTLIFLSIYFGCRGKQRRNKQLDKMNIQDLD